MLLAQAGRDAWNSWRREFPVKKIESRFVNYANFRHCNIHVASLVSFMGFEFGDFADFTGATFDQQIFFSGAKFGQSASFAGSAFRGGVGFDKTQFGERATFACAKFSGLASFSAATFGPYAQFVGAHFESFADFSMSRFGYFAEFDRAVFGPMANFSNALCPSISFVMSRFEQQANFRGAIFGSADFDKAQIGGSSSFGGETWDELRRRFIDTAYFEEHRGDAQSLGLDPGAFGGITFRGAQFGAGVDFSRREFRGLLDFGYAAKSSMALRTGSEIKKIPVCDETGRVIFDASDNLVWEEMRFTSDVATTRFVSAPMFFSSKLTLNTSFNRAVFPKAMGNEKAANAYRTLKLAFAQQQAIREEQRFYRLEMAEEASGETGYRRWLYRWDL